MVFSMKLMERYFLKVFLKTIFTMAGAVPSTIEESLFKGREMAGEFTNIKAFLIKAFGKLIVFMALDAWMSKVVKLMSFSSKAITFSLFRLIDISGNGYRAERMVQES